MIILRSRDRETLIISISAEKKGHITHHHAHAILFAVLSCLRAGGVVCAPGSNTVQYTKKCHARTGSPPRPLPARPRPTPPSGSGRRALPSLRRTPPPTTSGSAPPAVGAQPPVPVAHDGFVGQLRAHELLGSLRRSLRWKRSRSRYRRG